MRKLLTLLFTFTGLTVATLGHAANGVVELTWGTTCTPIVQDITPTAAPTSMMASVTGNDQTHNSYQVRFLIGDATHNVPDAWRFDAAGCQGAPFITINHLPPGSAAKTCPAFQGTNPSIQIKDYSFVAPGGQYASTLIRGVCANTYPAGFTSLAATRYFLTQFIFDHTSSVNGAGSPGVTCGGFETPMCIVLLQGDRSNQTQGGTTSFITLADGLEHPFDPSLTNYWLATHGQGACQGTPVENKTWGQIKSQYRN
jgi:hypothetical protein